MGSVCACPESHGQQLISVPLRNSYKNERCEIAREVHRTPTDIRYAAQHQQRVFSVYLKAIGQSVV